jgi:6-phosphogluconolactonase (cycloisomerase 2 family)
MKVSLKCISAALLVIFGFALLTDRAYADDEGNTFVYTNNDGGANTVSGFSVNSISGPAYGTLTPVPGSPKMTGGTGTNGGFYASNRVTSTITRHFLYASNTGSNNISAFSIDVTTGALTSIGLPVATGGVGFPGISMAVTPNGRFLYAGNGGSNNISVFSIGSTGALTLIGSPVAVPSSPDGMKISPNGKFLSVAFPNLGSTGKVGMYSIAANGSLAPVSGSPFTATGNGVAVTGLDINCGSNLLFAGQTPPGVGTATNVAVFRIHDDGTLTPISGSTFTFSPGGDSNVVVLSPDNRHLFVSNQGTNQITSLDVASGGSLTQETDSPSGSSPFGNPGGTQPSGMGTNREGTLLYVANPDNAVTGFHIDSDGGLSPVASSPFLTGAAGFLLSLTVFPSKSIEGKGG